jgi:macrolide-specific efflux system membrane fusion protein
VTTYEVDVWPNKVPAFMRSGMTANVTFNVAEKDNVLVVPSEAIQSTPDGQSYVLMAPAQSGDKPTSQTIQTGITDGKQTEIVSGLKEGDKIVIKTFAAGQYSGTSAATNPFMPSVKTGGGGGRGGH